MSVIVKLLLPYLVLGTTVLAATYDKQEEQPTFWKNKAIKEISEKLKLKENYKTAKNVILFLGDGLSITTLTASRIRKGQLMGRTGEETVLEIDKLPRTCLIKTYTVDRQTTDSASASAAYLAGVKTKYGTIGVDGRVERYKCSSQIGNEVTTILDWAKAAGKSVGVLTTARVTHASAAGTYAHAADRGWEDDSKQKNCKFDCSQCKDIARQLIEDNNDINVIFGGGRRGFLPKADGGKRLDNRTLIEEWKNDKAERKKKYAYVTNTQELNAISSDTEYAFGLFSSGHMDYELNRDTTPSGQPHIKDMTKKAIEILSKNEKGFFLFVEGARIDHGHHDNVAKHALHETISFDEAISEARKMTSSEDTLTVVTADHSFTLMLAGYSARGNGILDVANPISEMDTPTDGFLYPTLMYGTGNSTRAFINNTITNADGYKQPVAINMEEGAHGGEDVTLHADGPMSHLFTGVQEQSYIPQLMAFAACIGAFAEDCNHCEEVGAACSASSLSIYTMTVTTLFILFRKYFF